MATEPQNPMPLLKEHLCFAVYSTAHAFNHVYKPLLAALDLTYPQYLVMLALWERDGLSVKDLGKQLLLDSGTLTPLLKRLEGRGLVHRTRDSADERMVRISLTDDGVALRQKARSIPDGILCASGQSIEDIQKLTADLIKLRDRLNSALT